MKKAVSVICLILFALTLTSCSGDSKDVSMYDLGVSMKSASDKFEEMKYISSEDENAKELFTNISDMDYSDVKAYFVYYATDGKGNADEIAVINVKDKNNVGTAQKSLSEHLEKRKSLYATYDTTQISKLNKAKIITYSSVAALIVSDDVELIEKAFYDYLEVN